MPAEPSDRPLEPCPYCGADHDEASLRCPTTDMVLPFAGRLLAGKFRFVAELGRGGMGAVWRARNIHVDREVALKLILPEVPRNPEMVARFQNEARVAARIGHAGICDILDFEQTALGPVIVMELLRGENLAQRIAHGPLPVHVAVQFVRQALDALEAAHRAGIIHRDLKPENLFLHQPDRGAVVVKLMDFGISKFIDRAGVATGNGVIMGTPEYMAPEQVSGAANADSRTDIWAIGAVLYKALSGIEAFPREGVVAILLAITGEEPVPIDSLVPGLPPGLAAVIMRCLSKRPADRFGSARELADALRPFAAPSRPTLRRENEGLIPGALLPTGLHPTMPAIAAGSLELPAPARAPARGSRGLVLAGLLVVGGAGAWWFMTAKSTDIAAVAVAVPAVAPQTPERDVVAPLPAHTADIVAGTELVPAPSAVPGEVVAPVPAEVVPTPPAVDAAPAEPEPTPLIAAGDYVSPAVAGEVGNQHWAKEYCAALEQNKFLGIARWKLANPREAKLFASIAGLKPGAYWTSANYRGKGLVVWLPRGNDRSVTASKKAARPLCVAPKA
jgi:serine/threonine-protein kinase